LIAFSLVALIVGYLAEEKRRAVESEREKRNWLQVLVASIGDAVIVTNELGEIVLLNSVAEKLLGWSQKESLRKRLEDIFQIVNEQTNVKLESPVARVLKEGRIVGLGNHTVLITRDGSRIPIDDSASPIQDMKGKLIGVVLIFRSDLERRKNEAELTKLAERLRMAMNAGNMGAWDWNIKTGELSWIGNLERIHGLKPGQSPKSMEEFEKVIYSEDLDKVKKDIGDSIQSRTSFSTEFRVRWPDGSLHWVGGIGQAQFDGNNQPVRMMGLGLDLTERKRNEETIEAQLKEKEMLLKEVHHRVKNNLQIISSLLSLQTRTLDEESKDVLMESRTRIHSMALIHEKLYQSADLTRIDLKEYIDELSKFLYRSYGIETQRIRFDLVCDGIFIDLDKAIPCGLMLNEIVSNCLKHAFPAQISGETCIRLQTEGDTLRLMAQDNGVGTPEDVNSHNGNSLGLRMIRSLVSQLRGTIQLDHGPENRGIRYRIDLPL
jgi:PAS domain S-box-containing protein